VSLFFLIEEKQKRQVIRKYAGRIFRYSSDAPYSQKIKVLLKPKSKLSQPNRNSVACFCRTIRIYRDTCESKILKSMPVFLGLGKKILRRRSISPLLSSVADPA